MAASHFLSKQYTSSEFVESAGAILFHLSTKSICLIRLKASNEYLLPKGRRGCGESRRDAALREVKEETGYTSMILPLTMSTRATAVVESSPDTPDIPQTYEQLEEPITVSIRELGERDMKIIWWYVAAIVEDAVVGACEEKFEIKMFGYEEAVEKLTFQDDRKTVRIAIDLVAGTYGKKMNNAVVRIK